MKSFEIAPSNFKFVVGAELTIRHLKRHRGEGCQAAEATRLEAGLARLEVGDRAVAALDEADLFPENSNVQCTKI